jgi:hypothetical protein
MNGTNGSAPALEDARNLLERDGKHPVFLHIEARKKGPEWSGWAKMTYSETLSAGYQSLLRSRPNTGILLGASSDNLCAIDLDTETALATFLAHNPAFQTTLRTRGARGAQLWAYVQGERPHQTHPLKVHKTSPLALGSKEPKPDKDGKVSDQRTIGEFRAEGGQSVIRGIHPAGCYYTWLVSNAPITIAFEEIRWPADIARPWEPSPDPKSDKNLSPGGAAPSSDPFDELLQKAKAILSIDVLWSHFGYEERRHNPVASPFRADNTKGHPSFSVYQGEDNQQRFRDHNAAYDQHRGDAYDFYQLAKGQDAKQAFTGFIELAGLGTELEALKLTLKLAKATEELLAQGFAPDQVKEVLSRVDQKGPVQRLVDRVMNEILLETAEESRGAATSRGPVEENSSKKAVYNGKDAENSAPAADGNSSPPAANHPVTESPTLTDIARKLEIFYDSNRTSFWVKNDRGAWIMVSVSDVRRRLKEKGFRSRALDDERVSQVDSLLTALQHSNDIDFADSLAGFQTGIYLIKGKRILVRDSPTLIEPAKGDWPLLAGIFERMLGQAQQTYLFGWLKVAVEALYTFRFRVGQALVLAGPADCGKSLTQYLITLLLGGRPAMPHRYMSGLTPFNSELLGCEHLVIEDEEASTDIRARRNFGSHIKSICANQDQSAHAKYRNAITLTPFWRLSISVNDEPENLMILPPIDESLRDKFILLKVEKHPMPMETVTDRERQAFIATLKAELPHFLQFLFDFKIPSHLASDRYGITHFHHPEILEAISAMAPETRLLELIDARLFDSPAPGSWHGTAHKLERELTSDTSCVRRQAERLLTFHLACGTYLGRLQKRSPDRFESQHTRKGNIWTIHPV